MNIADNIHNERSTDIKCQRNWRQNIELEKKGDLSREFCTTESGGWWGM